MDDIPQGGTLLLLKWLVIALTATMIAGMAVLVWLFLTRFPEPAPAFPASIALPDGATASAVTKGPGWIAVVTEAGEILIFDAGGTELRQRVVVE